MIQRNLKTGLRNIVKNKLFSVINILGLSIGIAVSLLITFWIVDELSFDKFHVNLDNLYTIYEHQEYSAGQDLFTSCTPFPLSAKLSNDFDEVIRATTFANLGDFPVKSETQEFIEGPCLFTDNEFLSVFSFTIIEGDKNALNSPNKIIITKEMADLFFAGESAIGKTLKMDDKNSFEVGAVVESPVENSSIKFKILAPLPHLAAKGWVDLSAWGNNWPRTTVQLADNVDINTFNAKIEGLCKAHGQENTTLYTFPQKKEHLYSYSGKRNRIQYIYQFLAIAFIIILIASINFINFSTACSEQRRPEIGIRKALGASKFTITRQFFIEKGMLVLAGLLIGFALVAVLLPVFNHLAHKTISFSILQNKLIWVGLLGVVFTVLFVSIAYPAIYMSSFSPIRVLRKVKPKSSSFGFKSMLVVTQFALSIGLIICSIFISNQLKFISSYNLGYNKDNLMYLHLPGNINDQHSMLSQELGKISGISSMTKTNNLPFWGGSSSWGYDWEGRDPNNRVLMCNMAADRNYFATMGTSFENGTSFSTIFDNWETNKDLKVDEIILNQEAIRRMGLDAPVGKFFEIGGTRSTIVGVVNNFNFESLRVGVEPLVILPLTTNPSYIILRLNPNNITQTINSVKDTWNTVIPQSACQFGFFDDKLEKLYTSEKQIAGLFKIFTLIAIFISCIGLFGLSLYAIALRTKEVGIRKVNGARSVEIVALINRDFIKWVALAFMVATPISYFIMNKWLENFVYKTNLDWWVFILAGLIALGIALLTVSWQSFKAARRNPVEALRYE